MHFDITQAAKDIFDIEIKALKKTRAAIGNEFVSIVELIYNCNGKIIITGMGKPGHIGSKIAATLASLGTPSFFMHPGEAQHGDLGMVEKDDIVMLLSYSGESNEITALLPVLNEIGCKTIAFTGNPKSTLARECNYHFFFPPFEEACYLHLAPTSSTTALLVIGDAIAVILSKMHNYTRENFGLHHPAGALGKKILVKVRDIMHKSNENSVVYNNSSLNQAIVEMSSKGLSMVTIVNNEYELCGIITDGDLRRMLEQKIDVYMVEVSHVMTKRPKWINEHEMAVTALQRMTDLHITGMPVLNNENRVVGSILMQDIIKAGIIQ